LRGFELSVIDVTIVAAYVLVVLGIGFWVGRRQQSAEGFFLAERKSPWPLIGLGMMAANLSGTSYIGLAGAGYQEGINVWNYEWMATLVLAFFALFVLPLYLRSQITTVPEFLERRYDRRARVIFSILTVFTAMFLDAAGALYAGATVMQVLLPGMPLWGLITGVALVSGVYVLLGGLAAVLLTDTIQAALLLTAGVVIFVMLFSELGSWEAVVDAAPPGGFSIVAPADDAFLPWPGIFTGVLWLGLYYWVTNHIVVQKVLSAKNTNHGRWGVLFCGLLQLPMLFLLILPGTMGRVIYPELPTPDIIWPMLAFEFLPVGLRGLVLAALLAALMSTLDSALNGASSLVTQDFIRHYKPTLDSARLLTIGRWLIALFTLVAALWAPQIGHFPTIIEYFQSFLGHITMPVVVVFLGGVFWKRATSRGALLTLLVGTVTGCITFVAGELLRWVEIQFLYTTGLLLLFSVALFIAGSLSSLAPDLRSIQDVMWSRVLWKDETVELRDTPAWKNYRVQAGILLVITLIMVMLFI
jgi:solute:Na+ symporter, SSS family